MDTIKHTAHGREYEIRSIQTAEGWEVATFYGGKRIARYTVSFEMAQDMQLYYGRAIEALIDAAKRDLDEGNVK